VSVYTSCSRCGNILKIKEDMIDTHPGCVPRKTAARRLEEDWLRAVTEDTPGSRSEADRIAEEIENLPPPDLKASAIYYAEKYGWPVFPLRPGGKQPAVKTGLNGATLDIDRIERWWDSHPDCNIGIPTGIRFDVIDFDPPEGLLTYIREAENLPDSHGQVTTPSCGIHLYIPPSGTGNRVRMLPGVDYRGKGGYVAAPPGVYLPDPYGRPERWSWAWRPSPVITVSGQ
jgi:Bifunctional DNA primase/polymerase, N-terminal